MTAAPATTNAAANAAARKVDMVLCRLEDYDDCKVFKDQARDRCSAFHPSTSLAVHGCFG